MLPEIRLYLARDAFGLWERIERDTGQQQLPPPFWAFPWAGGQALARYLLDHPGQVRGRAVLDLASGSGLVAIAAAAAGAASVTPSETDPLAVAAITLNAGVNRVRLEPTVGDLLDAPGLKGPDRAPAGRRVRRGRRPGCGVRRVRRRPGAARPGVVSAGVPAPGCGVPGRGCPRAWCWPVTPSTTGTWPAGCCRSWSGPAGRARWCWSAIPGRAYLPRDRFDQVTTYDVPVERVIEDADVKPTTVWRLR